MGTPPKIALFMEDDALGVIREKIDSREWWVILMASPMGESMGEAIEAEFYSGTKNAQFELMMGSFPGTRLCGLGFAHKSCMSPAQLAAFLGVDESDRDILVTQDAPLETVKWLLETFRKDGTDDADR